MPPLLPTSPTFLHLQGARRGAAAGLVFAGRLIPWGELAAAADELARWLARRGVGAGQHVGVTAANEPALVAMLYALWGLGAVAVPIGVRAPAAESARLLAHARASGLLADAPRTELARDAAAAVGLPAWVCRPELPLAPRVLRRGRARSAQRSRLAAIAYTSGTTGAPKGVMLTHENFLWATLACGQARGDTADSIGACLSPLTHTPVLVSHLLCRVLAGSSAVLFERFELGAVLEAVERHRITDLPLIGGMVFDVLQAGSVPAAVRQVVRKVSVGGAPTPMEAKRALGDIFGGAEIIEAYGQTESTDGVTMARAASVFEREGTVGRTNPYVVVAIARAYGALAAPGNEGEIVIGGPTVMAGYYRDRAATAAALRGGWLHTGDLGRRDDDGWFFVTGRLKEVIISGGENVSPGEVEEVLRAHPDVAEVAVIGTPHPRWGEQVTAVVVPRPGAAPDPDALAAFAGTRLAGFKKPRRIEFVAALPRNAANKVETHLLRQQFAG
ncbi:MAG TPA: AMP-binding protein [Verrucomicrobiae bacterium]|nr:AMP-binding protein [Verrucomicrobiae bacterium]